MDADKIRGVVYVIFSVLTALTNLVLMTTILCTRQLRLSSKYILVLVLSTCDLIRGLFFYALNADLLLRNSFEMLISNCHLHNAHDIYVPYILDTLCMSLTIALLVDFGLSLLIRDVKLLFKISMIMITCSIVASLVLVCCLTPLDQNLCTEESMVYVDYHALDVSTYFPQMVVLVFLCPTIKYMYSKHRILLPSFDPSNPPASPTDVIVAASIMVGFAFPLMAYYIVPVSKQCKSRDCGIDIESLFYCMTFLKYSRTFVIPLVWFANSRVRTYIRRCLCCTQNEAITNSELNLNTI